MTGRKATAHDPHLDTLGSDDPEDTGREETAGEDGGMTPDHGPLSEGWTPPEWCDLHRITVGICGGPHDAEPGRQATPDWIAAACEDNECDVCSGCDHACHTGREATPDHADRLAELGPKWHEACRQSHVIGTPCPSGRQTTRSTADEEGTT